MRWWKICSWESVESFLFWGSLHVVIGFFTCMYINVAPSAEIFRIARRLVVAKGIHPPYMSISSTSHKSICGIWTTPLTNVWVWPQIFFNYSHSLKALYYLHLQSSRNSCFLKGRKFSVTYLIVGNPVRIKNVK